MSKDTILFLCGIGVAVLPFLGFPNSWRTPLFVVLGALVVVVAISLRRNNIVRERRAQTNRSDIFVESGAHFHGGPNSR